MDIQTEYSFELINPTNQIEDFEQTIQFESAEQPRIEYITLVSTQECYKETPNFVPKADDPDVLEIKRAVKIAPSSKGITYRFGAKYSVRYPLQSFFAQHFGFPTIGVTAIINGPESYTIAATPTPLHEGNIWR